MLAKRKIAKILAMEEYFNPIVIEAIKPTLEAGLYPVKANQGQLLHFGARILKDGHEELAGAILYRKLGSENPWQELLLGEPDWNGNRVASLVLPNEITILEFAVLAWVDPVATCLRDRQKTSDAGLDASEYDLELASLHAQTLPLRRFLKRHERSFIIEIGAKLASFSAWYEFFPRSETSDPKTHGTFKTSVAGLERAARLGFDVVYLPPIHPIGLTKRKGKNNAISAKEGEPGSPWAIGSEAGGHKAIHQELGSEEDFRVFVSEAKRLGLAVALDFAIQCSPDHPYVSKKPHWFRYSVDGIIKTAENPPKKYEDIYPLNFHCEDWQALWNELKSIVLHWIGFGVTIFRVDNPHTKPFSFWQWLIAEVKREHPEVIFLAEAFTRPSIMQYLAKLGFDQSYTYFTWKNTKHELEEYLTELTKSEMKDYYRGNFFTNTPDILSEYLQEGGRAAFAIRLILAATLSPVYGLYAGYELAENQPVHAGSEEYLDSEKYQIKPRDWSQSTELTGLCQKLNSIRRAHSALQDMHNLEFCPTDNAELIAYRKQNLLCVINLDPHNAQSGSVSLPLSSLGLDLSSSYQLTDLLTGEKYTWHGDQNFVHLDPARQVAHLFSIDRQ